MLSFALVFNLFFSSITFSQVAATSAPNGVLSGTVTDLAGNAVAGAEVRLINVVTGETIVVRSDANGYYKVNRADTAAEYTVAVRSIGFVPEVRAPMRVGTADGSALSFAMQPVNVKPEKAASRQTK